MLRKDPLSKNPFHMLTDNKNTKGEKKKKNTKGAHPRAMRVKL